VVIAYKMFPRVFSACIDVRSENKISKIMVVVAVPTVNRLEAEFRKDG